MKKYFSSFISHFSSRRGFTLIELMVVLSVTAVLGALGIAGFNNYNKVQVLQNAANELITTFNTARSRAQSQVKLCSAPQVLEGYGVDISIADESYTLNSRCSGVGSFIISTKKLPDKITFISPTTTSFFFPVITGGVTQAGNITLLGYGMQKNIVVSPYGGISMQLAPTVFPTPTPTSAPLPTSTPAPTPTPTPLPGPIGWWKMDGNANDSSGNGNNGTVTGATLTTDRYGQANKAYNFNGVANNIAVLSNVLLNITQEISITAWVKTNTAKWDRIMQKYTAPSGGNIPLYSLSQRGLAGSGWGCEFDNGADGGNGSGGYRQIFSATPVSAGVWYHVVCTGSKSGSYFRVYVNGVQKANASWFSAGNLNIGTNGSDLNIGRSRDASFDGTVDDVRIYNRALSAAEVTALYNEAPPPTPTSTPTPTPVPTSTPTPIPPTPTPTPIPPTPNTYSQSFTNGVIAADQCTAWNNWRSSLTSVYSTITLKGSIDPVGVSCTGAAANTICNNLRTATATSISCGGRIWNIGGCGSETAGLSSGVVSIGTCSCDVGYMVRPCLGVAPNWGGINGPTCNASSQTITVVCQ